MRIKSTIKVNMPEWRIEEGLIRFWDGLTYIEGDGPGVYKLLGENHYWNGEEWWFPESMGGFEINNLDWYWNGQSWD